MLLIQTGCVILSAVCPICAARLGSSKLGRIDDSVLQVSALLHPYKDPLQSPPDTLLCSDVHSDA